MCSWFLRIYVAAYLIAIALLLIGTYGWFGAERDPLAGVFVTILGLPWTRFVDSLPQSFWPFAAALTPTLNAALIWAVCRLIRLARS